MLGLQGAVEAVLHLMALNGMSTFSAICRRLHVET